MFRNAITACAAAAVATAGIAFTATGIAAADPAATLHEGMQVVGTEVQEGTYHTAGPRPADYGSCFIEWLPYKGAKSSELLDIQSYTGASYVRLKPGDVVNVTGCTWTHE